MSEKKILIAYFSRNGENYVSGKIVDLPLGNTKIIAQMIQEINGGELFEIKSSVPYPKDYTETTEVAKNELKSNLRPTLINHIEDISLYNIVFLGFPNWWNTMPMPVFTFLDEYNFSGKVIIPFCTHEGSGMGRSEKDIAKVCPTAIVEKGIAIHGTNVKNSMDAVRNLVLR